MDPTLMLMNLDASALLLIPAFLLSLYAQMKVKSSFAKYSKVECDRRITGAQAAAAIMRDNGISADIKPIAGTLTDHYDPRTNTLALSQGVYGETSIAAIGVAAHEVGHLMQKESGYVPLKLRSAFVPVANIGASLSMPLFFIGLALNFTQLLWAGILLFSAAVVFQVITLPVEFNASGRAMAALVNQGYISEEELPMVRKVLSAAAMTYVAAALASALQLLRFIFLANRRR